MMDLEEIVESFKKNIPRIDPDQLRHVRALITRQLVYPEAPAKGKAKA